MSLFDTFYKVAVTENNTNEATQEISNSRKITCPFCDHNFSIMNQAMGTGEEGNPLFECPNCKAKFDVSALLLNKEPEERNWVAITVYALFTCFCLVVIVIMIALVLPFIS